MGVLKFEYLRRTGLSLLLAGICGCTSVKKEELKIIPDPLYENIENMSTKKEDVSVKVGVVKKESILERRVIQYDMMLLPNDTKLIIKQDFHWIYPGTNYEKRLEKKINEIYHDIQKIKPQQQKVPEGEYDTI